MVAPIQGILREDAVIVPNTKFYDKYAFGTLLRSGELQLTSLETLFLVEKEKLVVTKNKTAYTFDRLLTKLKKGTKNFTTKYQVFKDLRTRGYTVKTALKFGADFRVYDKGIKPGDEHAKWVVYAVPEHEAHTWHEFSAKNRVAHSTKKRLLIGVVDGENQVTYYEIKWLRP